MSKHLSWLRRADESKKAYALFLQYLHSPIPRTYETVVAGSGKSAGTVYNYASRYDWIRRAQSHDAHVPEEVVHHRRQAAEEEEHYMRTIVKARAVLRDYLLGLLAQGKVPAKTAAVLFVDLLKMEHQVESQIPIADSTPELDMTRLSDAELDNLEGILRKAGNGQLVKTWGDA